MLRFPALAGTLKTIAPHGPAAFYRGPIAQDIVATLAARGELAFGVMGSHFQPIGHTHLLLNVIDYAMDVQHAIDFPRAFFEGERTLVERGVPRSTIEGLEARGYEVALTAAPWGGGQAIHIDWDQGTLTGGSDPRKDGAALGY